ncbi:SDR family NAD(P)-dependent oxidoreductase [Candidatus Collierbacteria bacterium]|nr:SDR family NAD(P)-dependent oxidoreductase [Candidatus Collierbacteria bacterium]
MSFSLVGKKALVTGSTDGLGRKIALELAKQKADVIVHGRDVKKADSVVKELIGIYPDGKFESIVCDLNKSGSIEPVFSGVKNLDILINNAGIWQEGKTLDVKAERIIEIVNVNLSAPLLIARTLLPVLQKSQFGQILNVVSVAGIEIPSGYFHTIYSATKFGLQAFSEALEKEYDNKQLRIMGYYPGGMETNLFKKAGNDYKAHEPWMFDPQESVEAIIFMLTRDPKLNVKRMDLINHLQK